MTRKTNQNQPDNLNDSQAQLDSQNQPDTLPQSDSQNQPEAMTFSQNTESDTAAAALLSNAANKFRVADDPELGGAAEPSNIVQQDADGNDVEPEAKPDFVLMSEDAFFDQFCLAFDAPSMLDPDFAHLSIPDHELKGARAVSDRLYHRCANSSWGWLRSFVNDNESGLMEWGAIGVFVYGRYKACGEIAAMKQARAHEASQPEGARHDPETV